MFASRRPAATLAPPMGTSADTACFSVAGYITVFLVALVTDRAFLLHQPDKVHARWEDIYEDKHISWRAEQHLNFSLDQTRDDYVHLDLWCAASC